MENFIVKIKEGFGLGLGFILVIGLFVGVYAFVEPTNPPATSNFEVGSNSNFEDILDFLNQINATISSGGGGGSIDWNDCEYKSLCTTTVLTCSVGYELVDHSCSTVASIDNSPSNYAYIPLNKCYLIGTNSLEIRGDYLGNDLGGTRSCGSIKCCKLN